LNEKYSSVSEWFGKQRYWLHIVLFLVAVVTTIQAGVSWRGGNPQDLLQFPLGFEYSFLLLLFLSAHEFGHFIAARIHRVDATLPFYIPMPGSLVGFGLTFGTMGAVIRTRSVMPSKKAVFDIGVAGPIAGFIVCVFVLAIGFATLPGIEYLQAIHPGYPNVPERGMGLAFGKTLLYSLFESVFAPSGAYVPPMTEMYHYPMLCVGWFGLFVTALNLLPVGQLDGGHLMYSLFPSRIHRLIGKCTVGVLFALAIPEVLWDFSQDGAIHLPDWFSNIVVPGGSTWLVWALVVTFVIRFKHPPAVDESPLDKKRVIIGLFTILILILCFTPAPIMLNE